MLDLDWENEYSESPPWGQIWLATHWEEAEWPEGYQLIKNKLFWGLNLCIPDDYVMEIVRSYLFLNGIPGVDKLIKGLRNRYNFPPLLSDQNLRELATRVKRGCAVWHACEHPNWARKGRYEMTVIQPALFLSVCVYIFSLAEVSWQNQSYDSLVLGWIGIVDG